MGGAQRHRTWPSCENHFVLCKRAEVLLHGFVKKTQKTPQAEIEMH
ncbi:MAG: type II toxin-antitoxin system RelE/ParE family toxin [Bryobacterales bacterium]|nr:type II toxin-antitoxin system RelE/ParE family toxin [Bryobacterales bacterium]